MRAVFEAIDKGEIDEVELIEELLTVVSALVEADHRLAEVAIEDASSDPQGDAAEIARAEEQLAEGDDLVAEAEAEGSPRPWDVVQEGSSWRSSSHRWSGSTNVADEWGRDVLRREGSRSQSCPRSSGASVGGLRRGSERLREGRDRDLILAALLRH